MRIERMAKASKITPEDRAFYRRVLALRNKGKKWREVAEALGEKQTTVYERAMRLDARISAEKRRKKAA